MMPIYNEYGAILEAAWQAAWKCRDCMKDEPADPEVHEARNAMLLARSTLEDGVATLKRKANRLEAVLTWGGEFDFADAVDSLRVDDVAGSVHTDFTDFHAFAEELKALLAKRGITVDGGRISCST